MQSCMTLDDFLPLIRTIGEPLRQRLGPSVAPEEIEAILVPILSRWTRSVLVGVTSSSRPWDAEFRTP